MHVITNASANRPKLIDLFCNLIELNTRPFRVRRVIQLRNKATIWPFSKTCKSMMDPGLVRGCRLFRKLSGDSFSIFQLKRPAIIYLRSQQRYEVYQSDQGVVSERSFHGGRSILSVGMWDNRVVYIGQGGLTPVHLHGPPDQQTSGGASYIGKGRLTTSACMGHPISKRVEWSHSCPLTSAKLSRLLKCQSNT